MRLKAVQLLLCYAVFVQYGPLKPCYMDEAAVGIIRPPAAAIESADAARSRLADPGEDPADLQNLACRVGASSAAPAWEHGALQPAPHAAAADAALGASALLHAPVPARALPPAVWMPDPPPARNLPLLI